MSKTLRKILLIRHAEKPVPDLGIGGVDEQGVADRRSLSVRGWQRAGALVRFFAPLHGAFAHRLIERPDALFAASPRIKSLRPVQTLGDLSLHLKLPIRQTFDSAEDEAALVDAMNRDATVALVSWRSEAMGTLARVLVDDDDAVPAWDKTRFDLVWVLTRVRNRWCLDQVPQLLLPGDRTEPIRAPHADTTEPVLAK